jgi:hypothetical protein
MLDLSVLTDCAFHIANVVIREDAKGNAPAADRAHARMTGIFDALDPDDSNTVVVALARRLGRVRATAVMIEPNVIEIACRMKATV